MGFVIAYSFGKPRLFNGARRPSNIGGRAHSQCQAMPGAGRLVRIQTANRHCDPGEARGKQSTRPTISMASSLTTPLTLVIPAKAGTQRKQKTTEQRNPEILGKIPPVRLAPVRFQLIADIGLRCRASFSHTGLVAMTRVLENAMLRSLLLSAFVLGFSAACVTPTDSPSSLVSPADRATFRDCRDCPEMVIVPSGKFMMGSPPDQVRRDELEGPQRRVTIRRFAVGRFHVTRSEWSRFVAATNRPVQMGCVWSGGAANDFKAEAAASWRDLGFAQDDRHPVVCVTWQDAQDYAAWLSARSGKSYRLLSEAEWEYAARAGSSTSYPWASGSTHDYANHGADKCCSGFASGRDQWVNTSPVGSFPANAFGLSDMQGNAMQWVQDCFSETYADLPTDGSAYLANVTLNLKGDLADLNGSSSCSHDMLRGGDWGTLPQWIRSTARSFAPPPGPGPILKNYRSGGVGFRVARNVN